MDGLILFTEEDNHMKKHFLKWLGFLLGISLTGLSFASKPVVLMFIIDGLQVDAAKAAMANGADNLKFFFDHGTGVEEAYCSSPSAYLRLPDNSLPWGTSSPPNVAMHTGTHVFESRQMDDIFLAARRAGIRSIFSGGADNYKEFNTADYCYYSSRESDSTMLQYALDHFKKDGVRLIRLHMQRLRDSWTGPENKLNPDSTYQKYLLHVDRLLGKAVQEIKSAGMWDSTYVIIAADHGMGITRLSNHPASVISSWKPYMNFFGPGIKKGKTIPYAETPDIALLVVNFLKLGPLQGHTDSKVTIPVNGATGTLLTNIFEGNPAEIHHPQWIRRYLESVDWKPSDEFAEYRLAMLKWMAEPEKQK